MQSKIAEIKVVFFDIGDTLVTRKEWVPGAKELIALLRLNNIRIGLISNTAQLSRDELEDLLPNDFEFSAFENGLVMLSSEIGIEKPNLAVFSLAVHHTGLPPWTSMFVGENLKETLAAQSAGMLATRISDPQTDFEELAKWILG